MKVTQPDGTTITICLRGDEWLHFNTTDDGYTIVKNDDGYYTYAVKNTEGKLVPTAVRAHDAAERTASEQAFLATSRKFIVPEMSPTKKDARTTEFSQRQKALEESRKAPLYDYTNFRGLVILVEYNDCSFQRADYDSIVDRMLNEESFTGFEHNGQKLQMTGSMRDYFSDNSMGQFVPHFDVVGPVKIDFSMYDPEGNDNISPITYAAIEAADSLVDFSEYDRDGNGTVDMVYFIFAGPASSYSGNDGRLLWPHKWTIFNPYSTSYSNYWVHKDGVRFNTYACSTEISGWTSSQNNQWMSGIGTMCHEFSHVLGLPDLYDTNYETGGQSTHPDDWSLMAGGGHLNRGYTPCGYTLYERYAVGFGQPTTITATGTYTLRDVDKSNTGYRLDTPVKNEYFLLENRQRNKWNQYLPGHGMLIYRVDSTNTRVWTGNTVNADASHNYFVLLRAAGASMVSGSVPFPGGSNVTSIDNYSSPNLTTWAGMENDFNLENIAESPSGIITFDVIEKPLLETFDDFEQVDVTGTDTIIPGRYCWWQLMSGVTVAQPGDDNCYGEKALAMYRNSAIRSSEIAEPVSRILMTMFNTANSAARIEAYQSTDDGKRWVKLNPQNTNAQSGVEADSKGILSFGVSWTAPARYQFIQRTGSQTQPSYVDNITFIFPDEVPTAIREVSVPNRAAGTSGQPVYYDLSGRQADSNTLRPGFYIVHDGAGTRKVYVP